MKKLFLLPLLVLAYSNAHAECQTNNVYSDIACYEKQLKADKSELNKIYNGFYASLDDEGKLVLNESQKAWIDYREKECNGLMPYFSSQSLGAGNYLNTLSCVANKTAERIKELQDYLH